MIDMGKTDLGFTRGEFTDRYGERCTIQDSSLATEGCIWLGVHGPGRMHLTRAMAADLIPLLQAFVDTGLLPTSIPPAGSPS